MFISKIEYEYLTDKAEDAKNYWHAKTLADMYKNDLEVQRRTYEATISLKEQKIAFLERKVAEYEKFIKECIKEKATLEELKNLEAKNE